MRLTDREGKEIPVQITYDSLVVFRADVPQGARYKYTFQPCDSMPAFKSTVDGRAYPKRRDDISYENELIGIRIYGPGTRDAGEKAFGYDIFFKHPTDSIIVPLLYAPETDDAVWAKVDSLRGIDPELAEDFIKSFSYHIDHGLGMDCYAVGSTLGAGVAAIATPDSIHYPWCYESAEILDNGPLRFTLRLDFAPVEIDGKKVTEHRIISLDSGQHLNHTKVWYEGLERGYNIVTGFPLRDDTAPIEDCDAAIIAYSDPTQGSDNGRALLGLRVESPVDSVITRDNHILISKHINPTDTFVYNWGFAWDRTDIKSFNNWNAYLHRTPLTYKVEIDL